MNNNDFAIAVTKIQFEWVRHSDRDQKRDTHTHTQQLPLSLFRFSSLSNLRPVAMMKRTRRVIGKLVFFFIFIVPEDFTSPSYVSLGSKTGLASFSWEFLLRQLRTSSILKLRDRRALKHPCTHDIRMVSVWMEWSYFHIYNVPNPF